MNSIDFKMKNKLRDHKFMQTNMPRFTLSEVRVKQFDMRFYRSIFLNEGQATYRTYLATEKTHGVTS